MKNWVKISLLLLVVFGMLACKKETEIILKDTDQVIFSDGFKHALKVKLKYTVNGQVDAYKWVNADLYISDTAVMNETTFLQSTYNTSAADWIGCPVLFSSLNRFSPSDEINFKYTPYVMVETRKYVGIAINGLGYLGQYNVPYEINYEIEISNDIQPKEVFRGTFTHILRTSDRTSVYYPIILDYTPLDRSFRFTKLKELIQVHRESDFTTINQIEVDYTPIGISTADLVVDLEWMVNGTPDEKSQIVDFDLSVTNLTTVNKISENGMTFERIKIPFLGSTPLQYFAGRYLYGYVNGYNPNMFRLRYFVYSSLNPFERFIYEKNYDQISDNEWNNYYYDIYLEQNGTTIQLQTY